MCASLWRCRGDEAYPAALALAQDGTLYTGSYKTGALWAIDPAGTMREIATAEERIGSVSGLEAAAGALYILDRITPLDAQGAVVWRYAESRLEKIVVIPPDAMTASCCPMTLLSTATAASTSATATRRGSLRYRERERSLEAFWQPDDRSAAPTGLAYDSLSHALLVTDSANDAILRVPIAEPLRRNGSSRPR